MVVTATHRRKGQRTQPWRRGEGVEQCARPAAGGPWPSPAFGTRTATPSGPARAWSDERRYVTDGSDGAKTSERCRLGGRKQRRSGCTSVCCEARAAVLCPLRPGGLVRHRWGLFSAASPGCSRVGSGVRSRDGKFLCSRCLASRVAADRCIEQRASTYARCVSAAVRKTVRVRESPLRAAITAGRCALIGHLPHISPI